MQCRTDTTLTFCSSGGGPQQPWSSVLAPVSRSHSSVSLSHSSPSLIGLLASVDVKQQKLTPSATVVASVRSTGGTVAGSVNATGFWHWQRQTRPPSFLLLLSRKMDRAIPQWSTLRHGSQMIDYNYRFCDNYFCTCFLLRCAVFHRNNLKRNWDCSVAVPISFFYNFFKKRIQCRKHHKEAIVAKTVITIDCLAI